MILTGAPDAALLEPLALLDALVLALAAVLAEALDEFPPELPELLDPHPAIRVVIPAAAATANKTFGFFRCITVPSVWLAGE